MDTLVFAYYCSGHGYGHATRVSAFARHLLSLGLGRQLTVHIVSSAPQHVFTDSIACGALYRYANIDPIIVQPLAYRVDRQKSVEGLQEFLREKDATLDRERSWLIESGINCVLSDAAFLGCLAAKSAGIPSVLITNFTFDSVYSYLATSLVDTPSQICTTLPESTSTSTSSSSEASLLGSSEQFPDIPIPYSTLAPLVAQIHEGYQHADLLLRLPGHIPISSFFARPPLPSPQWVDPILNKFLDDVAQHLLSPPGATPLYAPKPFPNSCTIPRTVCAAPLLVRPPSPGIYTPQGRSEFLEKIGLPNFQGMKILVVSFGGQVFKRPGNNSRTTSRMQSRNASQEVLALPDSGTRTSDRREVERTQNKRSPKDITALKLLDTNARNATGKTPYLDLETLDKSLRTHIKSKPHNTANHIPSHHRSLSARQANRNPHHNGNISDHSFSDAGDGTPSPQESDLESVDQPLPTHKRRHTLPSRNYHTHKLDAYRKLATPSHILIPGAPPVSKPPNTLSRALSLGKAHGDRLSPGTLEMRVIPPTPVVTHDFANKYFNPQHADPSDNSLSDTQSSDEEDNSCGLLPDENWIAVICGVSKEQWNAENEEGGLPERFYVAPRDIYMPDLIAIGDVVLGKLGYGMTSECVDACTSFVYVSRPLFIEEHGLRMYLDQEGVGIELSRAGYEGGEWACAVEEAYHKGLEKKEEKRRKEFEFYLKLKQMDAEGVEFTDELRLSERERQGREMARGVVEWVCGVWDVLERGGSRRAVSPSRASDIGFPENTIISFNVDAKEVVVA